MILPPWRIIWDIWGSCSPAEMASTDSLISAKSSIGSERMSGGLQGHTPTSPLEIGLIVSLFWLICVTVMWSPAFGGLWLIHVSLDQLFNENLTNDEAKKIGTTLTTNNRQQPCTLQELLQDITKLQESWKKDCSDTQRRIDTVITTINQHAQVIDVLIQQQPDITSVVWGAIRFLVGVCCLPMSLCYDFMTTNDRGFR